MTEQKQMFLQSLDTESLELLKNEAEKYIQNQVESENIIVSKATSMFQLYVAILISSAGYCITVDRTIGNIVTLICGVILIVFTSFAVNKIIKSISPAASYSIGASPSNLLNAEVFERDQETLSFLRDRVYNLDRCIDKNREAQEQRVNHYKKANKIMVIGLIVVAISFVLLSALQYFLYARGVQACLS